MGYGVTFYFLTLPIARHYKQNIVIHLLEILAYVTLT